MAAVVASKVKRQRSSRANARRAGGPGGEPGIQLEIDGEGRLREVGELERRKARAKAKKKFNKNAEYYQKVGRDALDRRRNLQKTR